MKEDRRAVNSSCRQSFVPEIIAHKPNFNLTANLCVLLGELLLWMTYCKFQPQTKTLSDERDISPLKELPAVTSSSTGLLTSVLFFCQSLWTKLSKDSHRMDDAREQTLDLLSKLWVKLQGLPNANPVELGAFFILLAFIMVVLLMMVLACLSCCCCCGRNTKMKGSNI